AFASCDFVLTPTSPTTAFRLGERSDDPLAMYLSDIYTVSANLAGLPAISIPCGLSSDGLPIGVQLVGNYWAEGDLLNAANIYDAEHTLDAKPLIHAE
ncbi:MAG TPA: amidase family protein, partial [Pyrinomonadaceae bacterium]|nr:amidase family protein [Pyrinomonadaceae bacterium]